MLSPAVKWWKNKIGRRLLDRHVVVIRAYYEPMFDYILNPKHVKLVNWMRHGSS